MRMWPVVVGSALFGALITVAIYEVRGWLWAGSGDRAARVLTGSNAPAGPIEGQRRRAAGDGAADARVDELERENRELREQLAQAHAMAALALGQIDAATPGPVAWPDDPPRAFRPREFSEIVQELLAEVPGVVLEELDCEEFPCVVVVSGPADMSADDPRLQSLSERLAERVGEGEPVGFATYGSATNDPEKGPAMGIFAFPDGYDSGAITERGGERVRALLDGLDQGM